MLLIVLLHHLLDLLSELIISLIELVESRRDLSASKLHGNELLRLVGRPFHGSLGSLEALSVYSMFRQRIHESHTLRTSKVQ